jgi:prophage regulatory protein
MTHTILRLPAVKARTGLSSSTIYLRMSEGTFPSQCSLGARAVGWRESDITEWINARPAIAEDANREDRITPARHTKTRRFSGARNGDK